MNTKVLSALLVLLLTGCATQQSGLFGAQDDQDLAASSNEAGVEEVDTSDWKVYESGEYGFSFRYPPHAELVRVTSSIFGNSRLLENVRSGSVELYDLNINSYSIEMRIESKDFFSENEYLGRFDRNVVFLDANQEVMDENALRESLNKKGQNFKYVSETIQVLENQKGLILFYPSSTDNSIIEEFHFVYGLPKKNATVYFSTPSIEKSSLNGLVTVLLSIFRTVS